MIHTWQKFQNIMMGLLAIVGLNNFITSFNLKILVDMIGFISLIAYMTHSSNIKKELTNTKSKDLKEKNKTSKINKDPPMYTDPLDEMGYNIPDLALNIKNRFKSKEDVLDAKKFLTSLWFTDSEADYYINKCNSDIQSEIIDECIKTRDIEEQKYRNMPFNNLDKNNYAIRFLLRYFSDNEIIPYVRKCKAKTCGSAIDWVFKQYDSDINNHETKTESTIDLKEQKLVDDVANVLMKYKNYNKKDAYEMAKEIKGDTLEERISNVFKTMK